MTVLLALSSLPACIGDEDAAVRDLELRSELSRVLAPPLPVESDADIGASMEALLADATQGSSAAYGPVGTDCVMHHYELGGSIVAVYERCAGAYRRLFVYRALEGGGTLWRLFGDMNDDERVDAWFDPAGGGLVVEDRNHDGVVDVKSEAFERLGPDYVIEGYDPAWIPPLYPGERILSDTDDDELYDRETITAGEDPEGYPSYWHRR